MSNTRSSKFAVRKAVHPNPQPSPTPKLADPVPGGANSVPLSWCHTPSVIGEFVINSPDGAAPVQFGDGHQWTTKLTNVANRSVVRYQNEAKCGPGWTNPVHPIELASISGGVPLSCMLKEPECGSTESWTIVVFGKAPHPQITGP